MDRIKILLSVMIASGTAVMLGGLVLSVQVLFVSSPREQRSLDSIVALMIAGCGYLATVISIVGVSIVTALNSPK